MKKSDVDLKIRPIEETDLQDLRCLYQRVWGRYRDIRYDQMRFGKTFDGLPIATVAIDNTKKRIIAYYGLWPQSLTAGGTLISAAQSYDSMTDPSYQGLGLFTKLARATYKLAAKRGISVIFGAPNSNSHRAFLKHLGFAVPTKIRKFVRPLSPVGLLPFGATRTPISAASAAKGERPEDTEIAELNSARERAHRNTYGGPTLQIEKSPSWLDFRYQDAGRFSYHWTNLRSQGRLLGTAVWGCELQASGELKRANLNELLAIDKAYETELLKAVIRDARKSGANILQAVTTRRDRGSILLRSGFIPVRSSALIARALDEACHPGNPFIESGWDLFGGDFDFT